MCLTVLTRMARKELQIRGGLAAIAEYEAENGAFTDEEIAAARAANERLNPRLDREPHLSSRFC